MFSYTGHQNIKQSTEKGCKKNQKNKAWRETITEYKSGFKRILS